jgi:hypothetical protein
VQDVAMTAADDNSSAASADHTLVRSILDLPDLREIAEDLAQRGLETAVDNEAIAAIPVVKTIVAIAHGVLGYRDRWLIQKLAAMLYAIGEPTEPDRDRWKRRLSDDHGLRDTGERVLAVIDRVTSIAKAQMIGRAFRAYLDGHAIGQPSCAPARWSMRH